VIKLLFLPFNVQCDTKKATSLLNYTGVYFEIDVWIPELKLGFEYQDKHHFTST